MAELGKRGLAYIDDGSSARSLAPDLALKDGVPFVAGDMAIDAVQDRGAILKKLDALEATTLLRKVMAEIDVAVFTFDEERELTFMNRAGARLIGQPVERALGRHADDLGLDDYLEGEAPRVINTAFPGGVGRWEIRRSSFRQGGRPHELLVLSDLSQPLREEERQAFQRLIRVIGHEMNNSLAPIKSIAGSLSAIIDRDPPPFDWRDDVTRVATTTQRR